MARVFGKCPTCGADIHVNDEKELGHCGKCGAQIHISESIALYQAKAGDTLHAQADPSQRLLLKKEAREREAEMKIKAAESRQTIHTMFQLCTNEQDFLALRSNIMSKSISNSEKARLLEALDAATKERLADTLKKAKDYEKSQESPLSALLGYIAIIGIGFAVNHFFSMTWPGYVAIGLVALAFVGSIGDKLNKKELEENKHAAALIEQYRKAGYKI